MPSKCFASWASPNWTRPPRRRDKNRSCSDQPQNPPPYLLGVTGHNVKHALAQAGGSVNACRALRSDDGQPASNPKQQRLAGDESGLLTKSGVAVEKLNAPGLGDESGADV